MGAGYMGKRAMARDRDSDWFYRKCYEWNLKFAWLPHRCDLTDQWIWLRKAYIGEGVLTGPGDPIIEHRWHDEKEHILWLVKEAGNLQPLGFF